MATTTKTLVPNADDKKVTRLLNLTLHRSGHAAPAQTPYDATAAARGPKNRGPRTLTGLGLGQSF